MSEHRLIKKTFEVQLWVDGKQVPLNHMMQEMLGNVLTGFAKTLEGVDVAMELVDVKIKRLHQPVEVDTCTCP
jgi:hypothetical protein